MRLDTRLARLERQAERVVRCAWCRYSLMPDTQANKGRPLLPGDYVLRTCRWCGNQYKQPLAGLTPRQRESLCLWYHTFDGETYRDERAYAALRWWEFHWRRQALQRDIARGVKNPGVNRYHAGNRQSPKSQTRFEREREELREQARALERKAHAREERLYGPRSFPLIERLKELDKGGYGYAFDGYERRSDEEQVALKLLSLARCMEACELVLWGEAEPETKAEIEDQTAKAAALAEERREAKRAKEEERERERQERERERLERLGASAPARPIHLQPIAPPVPDDETHPEVARILARRREALSELGLDD